MISFKVEKLIVLTFLSLLMLNVVLAQGSERALSEAQKRAEQERYEKMTPAEREAEDKRKWDDLQKRLGVNKFVHPCNQYTLDRKFDTGND